MAGKRPTPIGTLIDDLWNLRETKRNLEAQVKELEERIAAREAQIIVRLDTERTDRASSTRASVSISENIVPNVVDWDEHMMKSVVGKKQIHLVERRPAVLACREIWEQGGKLPGLEPFTKRKLNLRTLNK